MDGPKVTQLLGEWQGGREAALDEMLPLIYDELHRIARRAMRGENPGHTLQPTAVVNEAYMKLIEAGVDWSDRVHFFAVAARVMRRLLVDHARAKGREKRGGLADKLTLKEEIAGSATIEVDVLLLDEALGKLAEFDERKSKIVELHYFGGLTYDEMSKTLDVSPATVDRNLRLAKAWLHREMGA